jgi:G3E family GTPase
MYTCVQVEQVECADFVIVNKTDLLEALHAPPAGASTPQGAPTTALGELVAIVSSLNPLAVVVPCQQGKVPLEQVCVTCVTMWEGGL